MLYKLLTSVSRDDEIESMVVSLKGKATIGPQIEALGVPVYGLNIHRFNVFAFFQIARIVYKYKPDVIQGWMYHANLFSLFFHLFLPKAKLVWNIRQSLYDLRQEKMVTRFIIKLCVRFSGWVDKIIYNSKVSAKQHALIGYDERKKVLISNGFDISKLRSIDNKGDILRQAIGAKQPMFIVGMMARYHPVKDHHNFMGAAKILLDKQGTYESQNR